MWLIYTQKNLKNIKILAEVCSRQDCILCRLTFLLVSKQVRHLTADLPKELAAPVHRGERLGQAVLWLGEERLAAVDLLAAEDAMPYTLAQRLLRLAERWLS